MRLRLQRQRGARWRTVLDMTADHMQPATRLVQLAAGLAPMTQWRIVDEAGCAAYIWCGGRWARGPKR